MAKHKSYTPEEVLNECIKYNDKAHRDYFRYVSKLFIDKIDLSKITDIHFENDFILGLKDAQNAI